MELTSKNVNDIFTDCLFKEGEGTIGFIPATSVMLNVGFNPDRIEGHRANIISMLDMLPDEFKTSGGGGSSFLNLCQDKKGLQWTGVHQKVDELVCLGIAIGKITIPMSRKMWAHLPGSMPYIIYNDKE